MHAGERMVVRVEKAVAGGRMLARHDGAVLLIAGAIPDETVEVEIEKVQRGTVWATTRRVIEASPDRIVPFCDWACGGSMYAHVRYERQLELKRDVLRDAFARLAKLPVPGELAVMASRTDGYRMRARLHLRDGRLGFFREGSHEVCDAASTRQLLPETLATLDALAHALPAGSSAVREVAVAENCDASERAVHLTLDADGDPSRLGSLPAIDGLTGLSCGAAGGRRALTLRGSPQVTDRVGGGVLTRDARAFFQGNRYLLAELAARVVARVPANAPVVDLYAGVGLFSVALAARGDTRIVAVEGDDVAAADLKRNVAPYGAMAATRHEPVERFVQARPKAVRGATIIVDPPRTGVSREALAGVVTLAPPRIVYVSCDVATLARDVRIAVEHGYRLAELSAFDMFPNTAHIEALALLAR